MNKLKYAYITPAIPYVNDVPHLGHALLHIYADSLARYHRNQGVEHVLLSAGTDEHGGKIAEKAAEAGEDVEAFTDRNSKSFQELLKLLNISNDRFIRTSNPAHEKIAQTIWKNLEKDIYKGTYSGLYCTGCEKFVTETAAAENNGICPDHNRPYERIEEENYFFSLSKYTEPILKAIEDNSFRIVPENRRQEILSLLKSGLDDISVSRPKEKIGWGIPVPGDDTQTIYVWFEALMNYITILGYPDHEDFKTYWPATTQVIGKDILRFHAAIWPGMLLGLGLPLPQQLFAHSFILMNGQKMSKTIGNVVSPKEIVDIYGVDAFRYYFLRYTPAHDDGDFTWEKFETVYNTELANELGNLVQRVAVMLVKYQDGVIGNIPGPEHDTADYHQSVADCRFDKVFEDVWLQVRGLNQYIEEQKPWEIAPTGDEEHLRDVLAYTASALLQIADLLKPFLPSTSERIEEIFKSGIVQVPDKPLFPKIYNYTKQPERKDRE